MLKRSGNRNDCIHPPHSSKADDERLEAPFSNHWTIKTHTHTHTHTYPDKCQHQFYPVGGWTVLLQCFEIEEDFGFFTYLRVEGEGCLSSLPTAQTGRIGCWAIKGSRTLESGCWNIRQAGTHKMSIHDLKGFLKKSQFCLSSQASATCQEHHASIDLGSLQYGPIKAACIKSSQWLVEM